MVTDRLFQIATMKLLDPLTDKSKYNRRELVRFGGMTDATDRLCVGGTVVGACVCYLCDPTSINRV